jgi:hypothetical protein
MYLQMSLYPRIYILGRIRINVSNIYINEKIEIITYHETWNIFFHWNQTPSTNYYEQQSQLSETIMAWI